MRKTLLSITALITLLSTGTAHAYLSPGEVFPDLGVPAGEEQVLEVPAQGLPVLLEAPELHRAPSTLSTDIALLGGGFVVALGVFALIAHRRNRKIVDQI